MDKGAMVDVLKQQGVVKKAVFSLELSTGSDADLIVKGYDVDQGAQLVLDKKITLCLRLLGTKGLQPEIMGSYLVSSPHTKRCFY